MTNTMYLEQALDLIPTPACLLNWPDLSFVANNAPAREEVSRRMDPCAGDPGVHWIGRDVEQVRRDLLDADNGTLVYTDLVWGQVHMTLLPPPAHHHRPAIVVVSTHPTVKPEACLEHLRITMIVRANESMEAGLNMLDSAMQSMAAVASVNREFLEEFNKAISGVWARKIDQGA